MTLAEMLDVVEDKAGFEQLLQTLDVPAYSISSPICTGQIAPARAADGRRSAFARRHTDRPIKVTLPGPYLLTRAMFVSGADARVLPGQGGARGGRRGAPARRARRSCAAAGADFVQFDEPVLTEVAFAPGRTRTFMCAALAARRDPAEELEFAVSLINRVVGGRRRPAARPARLPRQLEPRRDDALERRLSAARGRISTDCDVTQLVLEYATDRAGALDARSTGKELGLGVVNPRTDQVEIAGADSRGGRGGARASIPPSACS